MVISSANRTAIFRCDASPAIGAGHVVRCLALADALRRDGWSCTFVCSDDSDVAVRVLAATHHELVLLPRQMADDPRALRDRWPRGRDFLIVDHYELDAKFETACRSWTKKILVIDDLADRVHDCDFIVEQVSNEIAARYQGLLPGHCRFLAGPRYALLRPEFAERRWPHCPVSKRLPHRVFIMFGGTDTKALSSIAAEAVMIADDQLCADVVIGSAAPALGGLRRLAEASDGRINIHVDEANPARLMSTASIAVGAAGGNAWERCCMGLPSLVIQTSANQTQYAAILAESGAVRFLGSYDGVGVGAIVTELRNALAASGELEKMSRAASLMCDGLGAGRVATAIVPEQSRNGDDLELRAATINDAELLLRWRSYPDLRQEICNAPAPDQAEYQQWLRDVLARPSGQFDLITMDGLPVGYLRLDYSDAHDAHEVSIAVAPSHQGQGIGSAALGLVRRQMPQAGFLAYVTQDNHASHRIFQKAGYEYSNGYYASNPLVPARDDKVVVSS